MNRFNSSLTQSYREIKATRSQMICDDVMSAQNKLIMQLSDELRTLKRKMMELSDLSPDSTMSLNPTKADFNAVNWVKAVHDTTIDIANKEFELDIAKDNFEYFFGEREEVKEVKTKRTYKKRVS